MKFKVKDKVLVPDAGGNLREGVIIRVNTIYNEYGVEIEGSDLVWVYEEHQIKILEREDQDICMQCSDPCSNLDLFRYGCKIKNLERYKLAIRKYYKE